VVGAGHAEPAGPEIRRSDHRRRPARPCRLRVAGLPVDKPRGGLKATEHQRRHLGTGRRWFIPEPWQAAPRAGMDPGEIRARPWRQAGHMSGKGADSDAGRARDLETPVPDANLPRLQMQVGGT